jgi:uncharacterized glyoxalase superfamily protein PhnB
MTNETTGTTSTDTADTAVDAENGRSPAPQVWPTFRAAEPRALIRFLVEAFGFEEVVVYGEGDHVDHAELAWPLGGGVMLGSAPERISDEDEWPLRPGTFGAYAVTDDPDALHARATAAGAKIVRELNDTDYGSREFIAADPEGNRWSFGTYAGHPRQSH